VVALPRAPSASKIDRWLAETPIQGRRSIEGLGVLFDVCFGERGRIAFADQGEFLLKSVPSGGARHTTEAFFAAFDGSGVAPGLYYYHPGRHSLICVREGDFQGHLAHATFDLFKKYDAAPLGLVIFASSPARAMWRYRDPRSFRAMLVDVGHPLSAFRHLARALGYRHYTYQKFRDSMLAEVLPQPLAALLPLYVGTLV
jgi:SagB-type dehydrogenase family enzyme